RQILHTTKSVGEKKVKSAAAAIAELNDKVATKLYDERLTAKNAGKIFKDYDLVLDGSDNFETRYVVNEACVKSGIPLVHGSILRYTGQLSVFDPKNGGPCYSCVYPEPPPAEVAPSCAEAGVLGVIPGIIGTMQGLEALKIIAGFGEKIIGKLLIFDGLTCRMKMLGVKRDVGCKVCSGDGKMVR
ncbi:MAG: ThiF family adenylyltransferase, partial [Deltaproteobacteria bacterium]|nr:ThiF family adenylyltransferase [Deltaproteobacteria bacterium]